MSKTNYFIKVDGKKVTSVETIVKRHGGEYLCVKEDLIVIFVSPRCSRSMCHGSFESI